MAVRVVFDDLTEDEAAILGETLFEARKEALELARENDEDEDPEAAAGCREEAALLESVMAKCTETRP
jgi:hypothetical protein